MPAYLSLGFYDYEFGLYWLTQRGHAFLREVMSYARSTWPHFEKRRGARGHKRGFFGRSSGR